MEIYETAELIYSGEKTLSAIYVQAMGWYGVMTLMEILFPIKITDGGKILSETGDPMMAWSVVKIVLIVCIVRGFSFHCSIDYWNTVFNESNKLIIKTPALHGSPLYPDSESGDTP